MRAVIWLSTAPPWLVSVSQTLGAMTRLKCAQSAVNWRCTNTRLPRNPGPL